MKYVDSLKPILAIGLGLWMLSQVWQQTCGLVSYIGGKIGLDVFNGSAWLCLAGNMANIQFDAFLFGGVIMVFWGLQSLVFRHFG
jgi:hypothetical protein